jgi:hypothetical protein
MSTREPGTTRRRVVLLAAVLLAVGGAAACRPKTPDVPPPSPRTDRAEPSVRITPFPGSCTVGWPRRYADVFTSSSTAQVGPSAGAGLDSLTCAFDGDYRGLPATGELAINLWRLDPRAGALTASSVADALKFQADRDLNAICTYVSASPTGVPGTSTTQKCVRGDSYGVVVGISVTTDIAAVTVAADAPYGNLNHARVDAFLDKLATDTLNQALHDLQKG